ncbi:MAG: c-type cytochrome [Puniceicoccales bacterium]|jgi:cytochrome c oxidase cbb3-type subunit 3|nr:c-type cytochrome [Puniceicoccales bacterium]
MSSPQQNPSNQSVADGPVLRPHEYDGIQEFDQKLPNWWLFTLYSAIIFAFGYWFYYFQSNIPVSDRDAISAMVQAKEAKELESLKEINDETLWKMSRNPQFVEAGRAVFMGTCKACHGENLEGGIGFNLADDAWVHGSKPSQIFHNALNGIPDTGMAAQGGAQLGTQKIIQAVAFILSKHDPQHMRDIPREQEPTLKK